MRVWAKDIDDVEDYTLNYSYRLVAGDSIAAAECIAPDPLFVVSVNFTDTWATVWLSGGAIGGVYDVVLRITTEDGRRHDTTFRLIAVEK